MAIAYIISSVALVSSILSIILSARALNRTKDKKQQDISKANRVIAYAKKAGVESPYITDIRGIIGLFEQREESSMVFVADLRLSEQKIRKQINNYIKYRKFKENIINDENK